MAGPFDLNDDAAYQAWRARKLSDYPRDVEELIVPVADPRQLSGAEQAQILDRCRRANMAIYVSRSHTEADKDLPRRMGEQFGLRRLDQNLLADEDAISTLTVAAHDGGPRADFIPYTDKPIRWHTDGYYNPAERRICGMILHCVQDASVGGENRLLDHELAYLLLRDENPEHIRALSASQAMTIPARVEGDREQRAAETGPVFSWLADGALHMRYTARSRSIEWLDTPQTRAAVAALERILTGPSPYVFQARMQPGMGLICNNVLHDRSGFTDGPGHKRVMFRARYYDRLRST